MKLHLMVGAGLAPAIDAIRGPARLAGDTNTTKQPSEHHDGVQLMTATGSVPNSEEHTCPRKLSRPQHRSGEALERLRSIRIS